MLNAIKSKKYGTLFFIMILVFASFTVMGCGGKNTETINKEKIVLGHDIETKEARINIVDTYTKDGTKYIIFETDISGGREFKLTEEEYNRYIGLGNDAVDCKIYSLSCEHFISEINNGNKFNFKNPYQYLLSKISDVDYFGKNINEVNFYNNKYYGTYNIRGYKDWELTDSCKLTYIYSLTDKHNNATYDYFHYDAHSLIEFASKRYSFIGEEDYTEDEIEIYTEYLQELVLDMQDAIYNN